MPLPNIGLHLHCPATCPYIIKTLNLLMSRVSISSWLIMTRLATFSLLDRWLSRHVDVWFYCSISINLDVTGHSASKCLKYFGSHRSQRGCPNRFQTCHRTKNEKIFLLGPIAHWKRMVSKIFLESHVTSSLSKRLLLDAAVTGHTPVRIDWNTTVSDSLWVRSHDWMTYII